MHHLSMSWHVLVFGHITYPVCGTLHELQHGQVLGSSPFAAVAVLCLAPSAGVGTRRGTAAEGSSGVKPGINDATASSSSACA